MDSYEWVIHSTGVLFVLLIAVLKLNSMKNDKLRIKKIIEREGGENIVVKLASFSNHVRYSGKTSSTANYYEADYVDDEGKQVRTVFEKKLLSDVKVLKGSSLN